MFTALKLLILFSVSLVPVFAFSGVIYPIYLDPGTNCSGWSTLRSFTGISTFVPLTLVVKPTDGPGNYAICIPTLRTQVTQNLRILGYVDTAKSGVLDEIDMFAQWDAAYRPNGIFFDNVHTDVYSLPVYEQYAGSVRSAFGQAGYVGLNVGAIPDNDGFFSFADVIVTVNDDYSTFNATTFNSTHISPTRPAEKQALILYNGPKSTFPQSCDFQHVQDLVFTLVGLLRINTMLITEFPEEAEHTSVPQSCFSNLLGDLLGEQTA